MKNTLTISMLVFLFILLNHVCSDLYAQNIVRQQSIGGADHDFLQCVIQTKDKGYLLASSSSSNAGGDKTMNSFGGTDYWIIKLNRKGKILWQKTIGGDKDDDPVSAIETPDAGYLIAGYSSSGKSGNKTVESFGEVDYWVVKLDSKGEIVWQNNYGGNGIDVLSSILPYPLEGYLLCGYSSSDASGTKTEKSIGREDYWVVKIDETGNVKWDNTIGGEHSENLMNAAINTKGEFMLIGCSMSGITGDKTEPSQGDFDFWLVVLGADNIIKWQKTIGTKGDDRPELILQEGTEYIIGGSTSKGILSDEFATIWVVKINAEGKLIWEDLKDANDADYLSSLCRLKNGGYLYSAISRSGISGDKSEPCFGGSDFWLIKVDSKRKKVWDKTVGGIQGESDGFIFQHCAQTYCIFGDSDSGQTGNLTQPGKGLEDIVMITIKDKKGPK